MDATNKEIRCLMQRLLELTDRNAARYDRMIELLDSCRATGSTPSSPSTSTGSDVCDGAEVPAPASHKPVAEVRAPASSDSDANLVTLDADGPAAPTRTTQSTGDPSHDTTESRSATGTTMEPTVHTATVDIISVLAAPAATDGTPDGQAIRGVASTPATCSTVCLPRHPVVAPVLVASSSPAPTEYGLDTNSILVEAVPRAMRCEFPAVLAHTVQMQQLYNDSEFLMPTSSQRIASKVHVHRPMPWPSFLDGNTNGDETRPLPWPSFRVMYDCESPSVAVMKLSQQCSYGSSSATLCDVIEFSATASYALSSEFKESMVLDLMCSSNSVLCDELVLSSWDPGQAVISDFAKVFCFQANFDMSLKEPMWQSLKVSKSTGSVSFQSSKCCHKPTYTTLCGDIGGRLPTDQFFVARYSPDNVAITCFYCASLSIEKTRLYAAGSIPSLDKLQEPMKLMAMSVSWQYFSHMELRESGNCISICLGSELERMYVVPFLSTSCYTTIYDLLSKWYVGWEYMISDVSTCSSCLNNGVIYTLCLCISGQILITLHKPQPPVQSISKELLIREPYGRNCCVAILSLVLHSILSLNGSSISSHVLLSLCEKPHGTGYLWQGSIHAEVTFWLDYSFARIDKRPQARQSPHAHCSTGLQIIISVMRYLLCQLFLVRVMSWLEKLLLPTSPRPNAYSSITHTMFWGAYLSCLIICKVWRHNHQNTVQMEIGWPPRALVGFITSKSGMPWLLVLMRIQGRRNIGVYHIYYQDQVCTDHDYQLGFSRDIGGTKKRPLSWDPGGRHMTGLYRHVVLRLPWDPGVAAAAWGQAAFQGGRDVRDPSYMSPWAGSWAVLMGLTYYQELATRYKYTRQCIEEGIQTDHGRNGSTSSVPLLL